jgi:hypothetical protein
MCEQAELARWPVPAPQVEEHESGSDGGDARGPTRDLPEGWWTDGTGTSWLR